MDSGTWPWSAEELRECDDDDDDDDDEGKSSPAQAIGWSSSWISGVMRDSIHIEFGGCCCCVVAGKNISEPIGTFLVVMGGVDSMGGS